jgi:hypothetical protein
MPDMSIVAALKLSHPVLLLVLMEADDAALHGGSRVAERFASAGPRAPFRDKYDTRFAASAACACQARGYRDNASAKALSMAAPSPCHALPCMQASVLGPAEASLSSIASPLVVCE